MDVMQSEFLRVLYNLDSCAPGILYESCFEQAFDITSGRDDFDSGSFELLHLGVEVRDRKADVVQPASGARLPIGIAQEVETGIAKHQTVGSFCHRLAVEEFLVPLDGFCLIRNAKMNVIDDWRNLCLSLKPG